MRVVLIDINPFMPAVTPISLGNLGAVLARSGHQVRVLSLGSTSRFSPGDLRALLRDLRPGLLGFGTYQRNLHHVRALARFAKQTVPECRVVLGGPQAMFLPDDAMKTMPEIDFLSRGEGEQTVSAIVEALESGDSDSPITGVTSRTGDGGWHHGDPAHAAEDLDAYPSPWLSGVLDPSEWEESILLTSRGCPCRCAFCITPTASAGAVRFHSIDRVLDEIWWIVRRGGGRLWFADPNFTVDPHRVVELLEGLARRSLEPEMWIETRADLVTPELITLMRRTGVHTVALGLESSSAQVCELVGKNLEPERVRSAAVSLLDAGIDVELFSQFALPGETHDDAMHTLAFVKDCGVPIRGNSNAQQMQLYFGSRICADPGSYGVRPLRDDLPAHLSIGSDFETDWMTRDEISRVKAAWLAESLDGGKGIVS